MTNKTRGIINGIISGVAFGMIPLFTVPVISAGMSDESIILYRFLFGSLAMLVILLCLKTNLRISLKDFLQISLLSVFYIGTAIASVECYHYISTGIASSLVFTDPIFCAIIGLLFLGNKFSWRLTICIVLATIGVMMMTGVFTEDGSFSFTGLCLGLVSGFLYALYIIFLQNMSIRRIPSLKLTFYVFFIGTLMLAVIELFNEGRIESIKDCHCFINLLLLGLIPTALSCICVTKSLKLIDSTIVSVLGAFEPMTAIAIGITVFNEPFSYLSLSGAALILISVTLLTIGQQR